MNEAKWVSLLGLATRARKTVTGEELVLKEIKRQNVQVVLLSNDASENTKKKILDKSAYYNVRARVVSDRKTLGRAVGKDERVVIGITDEGFAKKIIALIDQ